MRRGRGSIIKRHSGYSLVIEAGVDPNTGKRKQKWITVKVGKQAGEELWSNPLFALYPEIGPSHMKKLD